MPIDPNFYRSETMWRLERQLLGQEFSELTMQVLLAGAESGAGLLPTGLDVLVNWDVFNESALQWLNMYLGPGISAPGLEPVAWSWASNLTDTTRRNVVREIDNFIRAGDDLATLEARLTPLFGEVRAAMVATTEVTRIYASGNLMAWNASGVVGAKRWRTANDERVCPICGPLHLSIVELDRSWRFTPEYIEANPELKSAINSLNNSAFTAPPAHVRCRCWLSPVVIEALTDEQAINQHFFIKQQNELGGVIAPPTGLEWPPVGDGGSQGQPLILESEYARRN